MLCVLLYAVTKLYHCFPELLSASNEAPTSFSFTSHPQQNGGENQVCKEIKTLMGEVKNS